MITNPQWTVTGLTLVVVEADETFGRALTACFSATRWYLADLIHADRTPPFVSLFDAKLDATLLKVSMSADGESALTVTCKMQVTFPKKP